MPEYCPNCGWEIKDSFIYCEHCGVMVPVVKVGAAGKKNEEKKTVKCPKCGAEQKADAEICTACGASLK